MYVEKERITIFVKIYLKMMLFLNIEKIFLFKIFIKFCIKFYIDIRIVYWLWKKIVKITRGRFSQLENKFWSAFINCWYEKWPSLGTHSQNWRRQELTANIVACGYNLQAIDTVTFASVGFDPRDKFKRL